MANEIQANLSVAYSKGQLKRTFSPAAFQLPQATQGLHEQIVSATTADTAVTFTGITTKGVLMLQSLEATSTGNSVAWGPDSASALVKMGNLKPKGVAFMTNMNSTTTLRVKSSAGTVKVIVTLFEA